MAKLVATRVSKPDCEFNGWIIEGFPSSTLQLDFLHKTGH